MGFNNECGSRLIFDIETAPLPESAEYLIEPIEAPGNYKDPVKIANYISEKRASQIEDCALDPDLCRVVAVSTWAEEDSAPYVHDAGEEEEDEILEWFWMQAQNHHFVGFNCVAFDLPVLLRRSLYLGVKTPLMQIEKYRHPEVTDLQLVLSYNKTLPWHSLDFYAKRFGCPVTDTMDGSGIGLAVTEGRWDDVKAHVLADVQKTAWVAQKMGYFTRALAVVF